MIHVYLSCFTSQYTLKHRRSIIFHKSDLMVYVSLNVLLNLKLVDIFKTRYDGSICDHALWESYVCLQAIKPHISNANKQVEPTRFCDVCIKLHSFDFYRQTNQVNVLQGIVGCYTFQCMQCVIKKYNILNCSLESYFQWLLRIKEIDIDNDVWSFIYMLTCKKHVCCL